jgi:D-serine deaminase-like pyridoxal phosphate-dependent protein
MGVFTEVQPGPYLFMDADYGRNEEGFTRFEPSLYVPSTIISVGDAPKRAVLDAGLKSHSIESGLPTLPQKWRHLEIFNGGDEHMILKPKIGMQGPMPLLGERVLLLPGHVDPTFAMHRMVYFFRGSNVLFRAHIRN